MFRKFPPVSRRLTTTKSIVAAVFAMCWLGDAMSQETRISSPDDAMFGLAIRNSLLESRFTRTRTEQEAVSKSLMNSSVTGTQSTVTETRLRILPDSRSLKFELLNSGNVTSQTTGFNPQATVESLGLHHFEIIKPLWFDGSKFLTQPAHGTIRASQTPQRVVSTAGAQMPLLGPLSDRVAWNEVLRRTPQINQVVAEDVSRDVLPKIDRIVDGDFAVAQRQWTATRKKIASVFGNVALQWKARSGQELVSVWTQAVNDRGTAAVDSAEIPVPVSGLRRDEAVAFFVSEDAVSFLIEQSIPGGLKLTDTQLQTLQTLTSGADESEEFSLQSLSDLAAAVSRLRAEKPAFFTLEFAPRQPLNVRFIDGDIRVNVTFQILPTAGSPSGWMTTTFNLRGRKLSEETWTIAVRSVDVGEEPAGSLSAPAESLTQTMRKTGSEQQSPEPLVIPVKAEETEPLYQDEGVTTVQSGTVWIPLIRNAAEAISRKTPPVELPIEFDGADFVAGAPRFRLSKIDASRGVLRIALKAVEPAPETAVRR